MTDDQKQLLTDFESKVHHLMRMYEELKERNTALNDKLSERNQLVQDTNEEIERLKTRYESLKIARIVSISQDEISGAKERLSKLVREVDKCIALLNV